MNTSRTRLRIAARWTSASTLAFAALVAAPAACSDDATTGRRVALDVKIAASPDSKEFTNAKGWTVRITKAALATGALYFYDGETLFASRGTRALVKRALAHPGHYVPGNARGELLAPSSADLLAGGALGRADGVTGPVRSATFGFGLTPAGPLAAELDGHVAVVEGTAEKAAERRAFRAELGAEDVKDEEGLARVQGCPFAAADVEADGAVTVTVKLSTWLDQVAFEDVPPSADGRPVVLPVGLARNQLARGVKVGLAYAFSYEPSR